MSQNKINKSTRMDSVLADETNNRASHSRNEVDISHLSEEVKSHRMPADRPTRNNTYSKNLGASTGT